ncbi:hypothetical protein EVAR_94518_1 [Eumeta japonica]|uniref:Uncharacterized protein n=1 Tax=Eumeta variegata TaxID=151549 RepID=A0A4C1UVE4_EUMVA|nr:hypothetical protein EVAR_94518_1 [Eumeta japonica]
MLTAFGRHIRDPGRFEYGRNTLNDMTATTPGTCSTRVGECGGEPAAGIKQFTSTSTCYRVVLAFTSRSPSPRARRGGRAARRGLNSGAPSTPAASAALRSLVARLENRSARFRRLWREHCGRIIK